MPAALIAAAFRLPRRVAGSQPGRVPNPWTAGGFALICGSAVLLVPRTWGWGAPLAILSVDLVAAGLIWLWSRRAAWGQGHVVAVASGAAVTYAWHAFVETPVMGGGLISRIGNAIFAAGAVALIWFAAKRSAKAQRAVREALVQQV